MENSASSEPEIVLRLLYRALIEIRMESVASENRKIFHLSDLFHTIPLEILKREMDGEFKEILERLHLRAEQKGMSGWLEHGIAEIIANREQSFPRI